MLWSWLALGGFIGFPGSIHRTLYGWFLDIFERLQYNSYY